MQLAGPWVLDQGLNLGPRRQRVDVPSANRWTAFSEKRMLSGDLLRPLRPPQSLKARTRGVHQRSSSGLEQRHLDLFPTYHPASRTHTPACSPSPGLPGTARAPAPPRGRAASSSDVAAFPPRLPVQIWSPLRMSRTC